LILVTTVKILESLLLSLLDLLYLEFVNTLFLPFGYLNKKYLLKAKR